MSELSISILKSHSLCGLGVARWEALPAGCAPFLLQVGVKEALLCSKLKGKALGAVFGKSTMSSRRFQIK